MVDANGALSFPFEKGAQLAASSATFQAIASSPGDAAATLSKIYFPFFDIENDGFPVPGIVISDCDEFPQSMTRMGQQSGALEFSFFLLANPDFATDPKGDLIDFRNTLSTILQEMLNNARNPVGDGSTYWGAVKWTKKQTPTILRPNQMNGLTVPIRTASFVFEWN